MENSEKIPTKSIRYEIQGKILADRSKIEIIESNP